MHRTMENTIQTAFCSRDGIQSVVQKVKGTELKINPGHTHVFIADMRNEARLGVFQSHVDQS